MKSFKIIIGGDLVPTKSNYNLFEKADIKGLLSEELSNELKKVDYRIFNLEVPLLDETLPIKKCGPNLIAPTTTIQGIKAINPDLLTLANNHILDHGEKGLFSTIELLEKHKISYCGAGKNLEAASKAFILEKNGLKIGIYACAEHEFTIATEKTAGANPFDPLESLDHIVNLKKDCDFVIVLYHGGKEHYRYPSPNLQKICRKMIEKGSDLVVCQHSHCIGCFEEYLGNTIVYGQGNFLFDNCDNEFWNTSILIKVDFKERVEIEYIPVVKRKQMVRLADDNQSKEILEEFYKRSKEILEKDFIEKEYMKFAKEYMINYLIAFRNKTFVFRVLNKLSNYKLVERLYKQKQCIIIQNFIECEAHRELILSGLKQKE